uniref:Uncharacterized protein TCIL3000_11_15910 n=1 Tax=Trypanosoma congolense (strain IL3000) TaxID=1068625 RepID=G0V358_TRYCI|nr:unnamed protein product [Trypanosoma congolense IL3000]
MGDVEGGESGPKKGVNEEWSTHSASWKEAIAEHKEEEQKKPGETWGLKRDRAEEPIEEKSGMVTSSVETEQSTKCLATPRKPSPSSIPSLICRTVLSEESSQPLSAVSIDLETTGFSPRCDEIVSIAVVPLRWDPSVKRGWMVTDSSFYSLVKPSRKCRRAAQAIHRLSDAALQAAPTFEDILPRLSNFLSAAIAGNPPPCGAEGSGGTCNKQEEADVAGAGSGKTPLEVNRSGCSPSSAGPPLNVLKLPPIIAHNARFDSQFLQNQLTRCGWQVMWDELSPTLCTRSLFCSMFPGTAGSLNTACRFFGIDAPGRNARHNALQDAALCANLFVRLSELCKPQGGVPEAPQCGELVASEGDDREKTVEDA